LGETSKQLN